MAEFQTGEEDPSHQNSDWLELASSKKERSISQRANIVIINSLHMSNHDGCVEEISSVLRMAAKQTTLLIFIMSIVHLDVFWPKQLNSWEVVMMSSRWQMKGFRMKALKEPQRDALSLKQIHRWLLPLGGVVIISVNSSPTYYGITRFGRYGYSNYHGNSIVSETNRMANTVAPWVVGTKPGH